MKTMDKSVTLAALTWNLGDKSASEEAITDLYSQIVIDKKNPPTIIALSTQEENASNGDRVQDRLLLRLNSEISNPDEQYEIVETKEPQYHRTFAGGQGNPKLIVQAIKGQNRVNTAVIVKKPYTLEAKARIDFEPGHDKWSNKSIITISGLLKRDDECILPIRISGGHLDSNYEYKRRAHANKFMANEVLISQEYKNYDDILQEAKVFRVLMGDFNERDHLMQNNNIQDPGRGMSFRSLGFDCDKNPQIKLSLSEQFKLLHGTYGFCLQTEQEITRAQVINSPSSNPNRKHVTQGGYLDRISFTTGLNVSQNGYGFTLNGTYFVPTKEKYEYHGSDHLPVLRHVTISPHDSTDELMIIANTIMRRFPNLEWGSQDLDVLLQNPHTDIEKFAKQRLYYDSKISPEDFVIAHFGVSTSSNNLIVCIKSRQQELKSLEDNFEKLKTRLHEIKKADSKSVELQAELSHIFNLITQFNLIHNRIKELLCAKRSPLSEKEMYILCARLLRDAQNELNFEIQNLLNSSLSFSKYYFKKVLEHLEMLNTINVSIRRPRRRGVSRLRLDKKAKDEVYELSNQLESSEDELSQDEDIDNRLAQALIHKVITEKLNLEPEILWQELQEALKLLKQDSEQDIISMVMDCDKASGNNKLYEHLKFKQEKEEFSEQSKEGKVDKINTKTAANG